MTKQAPDPSDLSHVLDDPARHALLGPHAEFAERVGDVLRYPPEMSFFTSLPPRPTEADWRDAAKLLGPGGILTAASDAVPDRPGWEVVMALPGVQLVDDGIAAASDPEAVRLTAADVPEMTALVEHAKPGPFRSRTIEMGTYLGIRQEGRLVAMAGTRLHPPGHAEISAVCTHADFRGRGLAARLVLAVAHDIRSRGEIPFLHAAADNTAAIRLYEALGFRLRRTVVFGGIRVPAE
ncbi:GNAT family N-acetyltransferase [Catenulispora acidiphila]|nr:GNAT family N-acetyltransferase [Catenulispora acidiphila]